jgi:NADH:ubiquinone oxidoreductase subunit E
MDELDLTFVDSCVEGIGTGREKVLEITQNIQEHYGYLPKEALERVCEISDITPASIMGVTTFYNLFRHRPAGEHIVKICVGTACHVKGADSVYDAFKRYLRISGEEDTDADGLFTLEKVACLGCCTLAPAVQIGEVTYGHLTADTVGNVLKDYLRYVAKRR